MLDKKQNESLFPDWEDFDRSEERSDGAESASDGQNDDTSAQGTDPEATASEEPAPEEPVSEELTREERNFRRVRSVFDYVETFSVALSVLIVVFLFLFRYVAVDGDSMYPTLHGDPDLHEEMGLDHMDQLIISDFLYTPKTGDIVVVNTEASEKPLIKRVIATDGQKVRINFRTWEVEVDGVKLDETYINYEPDVFMNEAEMNVLYGVDENGVCSFTVGKNKVFVMGDNRNNSRDSRFESIGEQDRSHILGKVILRLFPFSEFGTVD